MMQSGPTDALHPACPPKIMTKLSVILRSDWGVQLRAAADSMVPILAAVYVAGMATRALMKRLRQQPLFWLLRPTTPSQVFGLDMATAEDIEAFHVWYSSPQSRMPLCLEEEFQRVLTEPMHPQGYQKAAIESIERTGPRQTRARGFKAS